MPMMRATKSLKYGTRRLMAGDEFEVRPRDARILRAIRKAEDLPMPEPPRRGRPPKAAPDPTPEPDAAPEEPELTNAELRELAEARGLELPVGYVRNDVLADMIAKDDAKVEGGAA